MFRRLLIEDSAAWFTITAFVTALTIYVAFAWRALRMKPTQVRYFEYLPFETDTPMAQAKIIGGAACPQAADRQPNDRHGALGTARSTGEQVS